MSGTSGTDGEDEESPDRRRRRFLKYGALAALGAGGAGGAWYGSRRGGSDDGPVPTAEPEETPTQPDDTGAPGGVPPLVRRYAPDLHFGALEQWYPTDPRAYVVESEEGAVVDGFTALEEYSRAFDDAGSPPDPTVFYRVVEAADGVDAVQYWLYSAFDQFTVNFHWHDWELLQVFVGREDGSPLLLSASAHSRASPNNEFLDPELPGEGRPRILSEVGSHSSALDVNEVVPSFERLPTADWTPDVTNDLLDVTRSVTAPFAYGLPRDEGARLPFVMPELDGRRLDRQPELSVGREDFVDERVTVGSWRGLPTPPADLPLREPGLVLAHPDSEAEADAAYALEPLAAVRGAVDGFAGPRLSFEFAVPGFAEELYADHIHTVGVPWEQDRFSDPLADVTDPAHRRRIDGASPAGLANRVVGRVRQLRSGADGALDGVSDAARAAVADRAAVSLHGLPVEAAVRLASDDPEATVTRGGVFGFLRVEAGEHLLAADGPGFAPLALRFDHDGGVVRPGADGELTVVANEDVGWIRGDGRGAAGVARVRVTEDYAGVVYEGRPVEPDRYAVAVHRDGRYTVDVVDGDGRRGAYRVGPAAFGEDGEAVREVVQTGKATLAAALRDDLEETLDLAGALADGEEGAGEVRERLSRAAELAGSAATAARRGEGGVADERLGRTISTLEETRELLASGEVPAYDEAAVAALEGRIREAIGRAELAIETDLA